MSKIPVVTLYVPESWRYLLGLSEEKIAGYKRSLWKGELALGSYDVRGHETRTVRPRKVMGLDVGEGVSPMLAETGDEAGYNVFFKQYGDVLYNYGSVETPEELDQVIEEGLAAETSGGEPFCIEVELAEYVTQEVKVKVVKEKTARVSYPKDAPRFAEREAETLASDYATGRGGEDPGQIETEWELRGNVEPEKKPA